MGTLIHAVGKRPNQVYRVYGEWGERRFPEFRSKSALYTRLCEELGLPPTSSRWDVVRALMPESEIGDLIIEVRSATAGVGTFTAKFDHMAELSGKAAEHIVAARKAAAAAA